VPQVITTQELAHVKRTVDELKQKLEQEVGVELKFKFGTMIEMAVRNGRKAREDLKIGICGEQGGHPETIRFCHHVGLDYVSCSGPRVPIARLAAAVAILREKDYVGVIWPAA